MIQILLNLKEEFKATLNWAYVIILTILGFMLVELSSHPIYIRDISSVQSSMELLFPLIIALLISAVLSKDWEEKTIELRICLPGRSVKLLWLRLLLSLSLWLLLGLSWIVIIRFTYLQSIDRQIYWKFLATMLLPPGLFLASLAVVATMISRMSLGGYITAAVYWAMDMYTKGKYIGPSTYFIMRYPWRSIVMCVHAGGCWAELLYCCS
jgi:hypothetical protein